ncbi:MAG: phosphatidate cytidylyltransferase, partial [Alphaproteobacteria bacterium]|nr:phosphatidate cytidylyltransferase [Alphaproteobacteria bacterium]
MGVRVLTALVLVPPALAAVHVGFPWFELMVAVTACLMGREWAALTGAARRSVRSILIGGTCVAAIGGVATGGPGLAIAIVATGVAAALIAAG